MNFNGLQNVFYFLSWGLIWILGSSPILNVQSQRPSLGLKIVMPESIKLKDSVRIAIGLVNRSPRRRQIRALKLKIQNSQLGDNPSEIFDLFCSDILPNRVNTVLYLALRDDNKFLRLTDYMNNIMHDIGLPILSWNPFLTGSLQVSTHAFHEFILLIIF